MEKFGAMTDQDLKLELRGRGLPTEGGREDFVERLTEAAKQEAKKAVAEAREMAALLEAQKKPSSAPAVAAATFAAAEEFERWAASQRELPGPTTLSH